jgi:hypothetical protein
MIKKFLTKSKNIFTILSKKIKFWLFKKSINPATKSKHNEVLEWAISLSKKGKSNHDLSDEIVQVGANLRGSALNHFKDKYTGISELRVLIHIPPKLVSPGGHSAFLNMLDSLSYLGIKCRALSSGSSIDSLLEDFKPTILLTSDSEDCINQLDWDAIKQYRVVNEMKIGLTASIEAYGNTSLLQRLDRAKSNDINFYYSFRAQEYLHSRADYKPFYDYGYDIFTVEFGANPIQYYPVGGIPRDIPYIFLASSNADKQLRYKQWLTPILQNQFGFLDGPGWGFESCAHIDVHKYLYARSKIGINLHIDDSIDWASEINERTYILAACGVPQLIDNPKLLFSRFSADSIFSAESPKHYKDLFGYILENPLEAHKKSLVALNEVYSRHTTFHRAEGFILQLLGLFSSNRS